MPIYELDPLVDPRYSALVESHPRSSVFHTVEWLEALRRTYRFVPIAFTSDSPHGELTSAIVFCRVNSWLTGSRLVSLPFSDHCEPLVQNADELDVLLREIRMRNRKLKYLEVRPRSRSLEMAPGFSCSTEFCLSTIDLRLGIEELYLKLDKNSIVRKIRRAEREHVVMEQGRSESVLKEFYDLLILTRRRHHLPPQPIAWFRNLIAWFGTRLTIRIARVGNQPIASILTLGHKRSIVYKYGCSDARFHNMGGMPLLLWNAIQDAELGQFAEFDLGRSEPDNLGLNRFKAHLGADRTPLNYWRTLPKTVRRTEGAAQLGIAKKVISNLPDSLLRLAGEKLYRHVG